jgi:uncharacterized protein YndB with AHSA1/START domain
MLSEVSDLADRQVVITRTFDAPPGAVFAAWTNPEQLKIWWGPDQWDLPVCEIDLRPGGTWFYGMRGPQGMESWGKATYEDIVDSKRIVYNEIWVDRQGEPLLGMPTLHVTVTLDDDGGKTKLTMTTVFETPEAKQQVLTMGALKGWDQTLDRLAELLSIAA